MRPLSGDPPRGWAARGLVLIVVLGLATAPLAVQRREAARTR